jgi:ABC-type nitrate/sulfonate/bicarbonate transport system ATPase subunit
MTWGRSNVTPRNDRLLEVNNLSKSFKGKNGAIVAFKDVSFDVASGEFVSILGPSGCGKTTLLHVLGGLEQETSGQVRIADSVVPERTSQSAYMFQKDLLLPWYRVRDNAALGLIINGTDRKEATARADRFLVEYGLGQVLRMYPTQLSGGMRQRVALIRTLMIDRPILLLDEPFGALDALTRLQMQDWLLTLWQAHRRTVIFVTHDVDEAVRLSDRVLVMSLRGGGIVSDTRIDLPRPRDQEIMALPEYAAFRRSLLAKIFEQI